MRNSTKSSSSSLFWRRHLAPRRWRIRSSGCAAWPWSSAAPRLPPAPCWRRFSEAWHWGLDLGPSGGFPSTIHFSLFRDHRDCHGTVRFREFAGFPGRPSDVFGRLSTVGKSQQSFYGRAVHFERARHSAAHHSDGRVAPPAGALQHLEDRRNGRPAGAIYGWNTLGAACGAAATTYGLLPRSA